jgi:2'-5' RNA ligase
VRLFIAICLPEAWHAALAAQQRELGARLGTVRAALRWVRPEGSHLTLLFLGERAADDLPTIEAAMQEAAAAAQPFALRLAHAGTFGGQRPRVLFTHVEGAIEPLQALQRRLATALAQADARPFSPHITLARVPRPDRAIGDAVTRALARPLNSRAAPLTVRQISLMQSELRPDGAIYTELLGVPLGDAP